MPELPEVETAVRDLKRTQPPILGAGFVDVWTDFRKMIKLPKTFEQFKKEIKGKKIQKIWRRGKNILFELSGNKTLLIHQ
ncbi:MAG: DNA-formamidopyrimidine glycosylase, partial [Candidatus Portnoybacteria bacterium CG23_combo_of_CG06-09_8_20_14_all_37_13]